MRITSDAHAQLVDLLSGLVMLILAIACAGISAYFDTPYPLFFTGWFTRSAWSKTKLPDFEGKE